MLFIFISAVSGREENSPQAQDFLAVHQRYFRLPIEFFSNLMKLVDPKSSIRQIDDVSLKIQNVGRFEAIMLTKKLHEYQIVATVLEAKFNNSNGKIRLHFPLLKLIIDCFHRRCSNVSAHGASRSVHRLRYNSGIT